MSKGAMEGMDEVRLQHMVEQFVYREVGLLEAGDYDEWLSLFTDDAHYWMPTRETRSRREDGVRSANEMLVYDDDKKFMRARVERMKSDMAHAEQPPSRLRYLVTNIRTSANPAAAGELSVRCNLMVYQTRMERMETCYVGQREDRLLLSDGTLRIMERKVTLDHTMLPRAISIFF